MGIIQEYSHAVALHKIAMESFGRGEPRHEKVQKTEEASSIRLVEHIEHVRDAKNVSRFVSVTEKGNLTNPFSKIFTARISKSEMGQKILPILTEAQYEALLRTKAHDRDLTSISTIDFTGYADIDGKKRFVDFIVAKGLGKAEDSNAAGDVRLISLGKRGANPTSPEDVGSYALLVSFPEVEGKNGYESSGGQLHEFFLTSVDPSVNPRARLEARALFDAVAQYVDEDLSEEHLEKFVDELQKMLRRRIHDPEVIGHIQPLMRMLAESRRAANAKNERSIPEHGNDIRHLIKERDSRPREPRELGDQSALAIVTNRIMSVHRDIAEHGETPEGIETLHDLLIEKEQLEAGIDAQTALEDVSNRLMLAERELQDIGETQERIQKVIDLTEEKELTAALVDVSGRIMSAQRDLKGHESDPDLRKNLQILRKVRNRVIAAISDPDLRKNLQFLGKEEIAP